MTLDSLEFRTPITEYTRQNTTKVPLLFHEVWQRRLKNLWAYVQSPVRILPTSASRDVTADDLRAIVLCTGTITLTLPLKSQVGTTYFFFNYDTGVITIAGTINGNPSYILTSQYQYVAVTSVDGVNWIITAQSP